MTKQKDRKRGSHSIYRDSLIRLLFKDQIARYSLKFREIVSNDRFNLEQSANILAEGKDVEKKCNCTYHLLSSDV
jgi:hypothetical protein